VRGIDTTDIFVDHQDKARFLERLGEKVTEGQCSVYAWVLMDNHIHLLFKSGRRGISDIMRKLLTCYAQYFNHRHKRTGHLFQNRYKSILCDEENYLLALIRYIHLNPVRAQYPHPLFFTFSLPRNASRICTICLRFGSGSFSTWLKRRQRRVS
jgi:putative transposase